jgi:hypothetical protein
VGRILRLSSMAGQGEVMLLMLGLARPGDGSVPSGASAA